ncbi:MAG TPA: lytic transglycosylase domain-containing protein [Terriglobales bacterium]|nr:lytic transglycosylase domain-containing protein [Terriglobales bacterium]
MKVLVKAFLFTVALVAPAAQAAVPTDVGQFSVKCAAFYASAFGVPVELVDAVIQVESSWNPYAVSNKGAEGLMQLMPATAIRFGVRNRFDIEDNIRGGVAYLALLIRLFRGDLRLVLAAYNAGESPILLRGLAYSSPEVFIYVTRVAQVYRALRIQAGRNPAIFSVSTASGGER